MSNIPRTSSCFIVVDYVMSLGYTIHEQIPLIITDSFKLSIRLMDFLNADFFRVVNGSWKAKLIEKVYSQEESDGIIEHGKRLRAHIRSFRRKNKIIVSF